MYGLVHRALQCFAQDTYGDAFWSEVAVDAGLDIQEFEAMFSYPDAHLESVLGALSRRLGKDSNQVCEDVGAYLVTHPRMESVRRLLRFGGANFEDFLLSLDDLHDRVKLALPDLELPKLEVESYSANAFNVLVYSEHHGFGAVLQGILRAMGDDYGALVMLGLTETERFEQRIEQVRVELFEADFAVGRGFGLVAEGQPK